MPTFNYPFLPQKGHAVKRPVKITVITISAVVLLGIGAAGGAAIMDGISEHDASGTVIDGGYLDPRSSGEKQAEWAEEQGYADEDELYPGEYVDFSDGDSFTGYTDEGAIIGMTLDADPIEELERDIADVESFTGTTTDFHDLAYITLDVDNRYGDSTYYSARAHIYDLEGDEYEYMPASDVAWALDREMEGKVDDDRDRYWDLYEQVMATADEHADKVPTSARDTITLIGPQIPDDIADIHLGDGSDADYWE